MDVARKVVILARECGLQLGLDDLDVASLVPPKLAQLASPADYMAALPQVRCYSDCYLTVHLT
jgi:aspartokinase/homoserine dehydrogenase 1